VVEFIVTIFIFPGHANSKWLSLQIRDQITEEASGSFNPKTDCGPVLKQFLL